jgi:hypothetical protein
VWFRSSLTSDAYAYRWLRTGFLPGSAVKDDGSLNAGLRMSKHLLQAHTDLMFPCHVGDQQFALEWIQKHVGFVILDVSLTI